MAGWLQDAEICAGRGRTRTGLDEMNFKIGQNEINNNRSATAVRDVFLCPIFVSGLQPNHYIICFIKQNMTPHASTTTSAKYKGSFVVKLFFKGCHHDISNL